MFSRNQSNQRQASLYMLMGRLTLVVQKKRGPRKPQKKIWAIQELVFCQSQFAPSPLSLTLYGSSTGNISLSLYSLFALTLIQIRALINALLSDKEFGLLVNNIMLISFASLLFKFFLSFCFCLLAEFMILLE